MKNLIITESEKNRILGMHKSATSRHYIINEGVLIPIAGLTKDETFWYVLETEMSEANSTKYGINQARYDATYQSISVQGVKRIHDWYSCSKNALTERDYATLGITNDGVELLKSACTEALQNKKIKPNTGYDPKTGKKQNKVIPS